MDWRNIAIIFVNCLVVGLGYYLGNALLGVIAAFLFVALVFCILLVIEIF